MSTRWPIKWAHDEGYVRLWRILLEIYDHDRVLSIMNGTDKAWNDDLAAWRSIGRERAA
jgi:hypothetical protein